MKTLNENQNTLPINLKREIGSGKVQSSSGHNFYRLSKVLDILLLDSITILFSRSSIQGAHTVGPELLLLQFSMQHPPDQLCGLTFVESRPAQ